MRWIYYNRNSAAEAAEHERLLADIDAFWQALAAKTNDLSALFSRQKEWDLPAWMQQHLEPINSRLPWEFGPAVAGSGHRLVITPEAERGLRPLVATMIERAPRLPGWEFYPHRLAESAEMAQQMVDVRSGGSLEGVEVEARIGEQHLVDLVFRGPKTRDAEDQQAFNDAIVATETLLGEECLDKWIGAIEVAPLRNGLLRGLLSRGKSAGSIPLDRLKERVDALVSSLREQLPPKPFHRRIDEVEWAVFQLQPEERDDYPDQSDMFVGKSADQSLWIATHCGRPFSSERFSRCGETFCYVKLDGSEGLEGSKFQDKSEIEDALDAVLKPAGLGCHIGGGTGLRYSYIDLALTDRDRGLETVRKVLREGKLPRRSWILFFDADLVDEWIGIHDDTPPPPASS
jgi:hypothetical protein